MKVLTVAAGKCDEVVGGMVKQEVKEEVSMCES